MARVRVYTSATVAQVQTVRPRPSASAPIAAATTVFVVTIEVVPSRNVRSASA